MNDVTKVLCERRSIRKFKPDQIPSDVLNEILKCGTFAPSGKNMQSAKIVVIQNKKLISEIAKVNGSFVEVYKATIFSPLLSFPWVVQVSGRDNANEFYKFLKSARISQIKKRFGFKYSKEGYRKIS